MIINTDGGGSALHKSVLCIQLGIAIETTIDVHVACLMVPSLGRTWILNRRHLILRSIS